MITARGKVTEKMEGYESGADIYLTKPTTMEELNAAIHALSRRLKHVAPSTSALKLDLVKLTLSGEGGEVGISSHEGALLSAFVRAPGQRLENWQLIELLGKSEADYSKANLEVQIVRLRKKLTKAGGDEYSIKVVRQLGYQLGVAVRVV